MPEIEREMFDILPLGPNEPACVGLVVAEGTVGAAKATTLSGYRKAPEPAENMPERVLWEAVGAALQLPVTSGWEHVVLAEHKSEDASVTVRIMSVRTSVRETVRRVLGEPRTSEERMTVAASESLPQPESAGPSLEECIAQADEQVSLFAKVMNDLEDNARRQGVKPTAHGRERFRWWSDPAGRAADMLRHRALLVLLLRAGRVADAEWLQGFAEVMRSVVLPQPTSARNTEVLAMSAAVVLVAAEAGGALTLENFQVRTAAMSHLTFRARGLFDRAGISADRPDGDGLPRGGLMTVRFLMRWRNSAFARLEVSHKLAAALCLTDVPAETELRAPWEAWSLVVPDGLLGATQSARVWCLGLEPQLIVTSAGKVEPWSEAAVGGPVASELLLSLVKAACVVLSDPDRRKAESKWGGGITQAPRGKRPHGPPQEGARYVLAQPVTIDLRETVREALSGRRGGGGIPKHQFLVRGHPRQQAWGPGHTLRRYKWIEPYWKGDPEARILLRGHQVKDD
jgi:hypothetical protein